MLDTIVHLIININNASLALGALLVAKDEVKHYIRIHKN